MTGFEDRPAKLLDAFRYVSSREVRLRSLPPHVCAPLYRELVAFIREELTSNSGGEKMRKDKASSPSPTITVINLAEAKELWDSATRYLGHTKGDWVKRELAGYVLNRVKTHLGLRGAEIDMDQAAWQMNELIKEIREEFELPSPPEENTTSNSGQEK